jgi:hypothetical protein
MLGDQGNLFVAAPNASSRPRRGRNGGGAAADDAVAGVRGKDPATAAIPPALYLGRVELGAIAALIARAAAEPVPLAEMERRLRDAQRGLPPPVNGRFTLSIPFGFRVTYLHERLKGGVMRHLAVSCDRPVRVPIEVLAALLREFGFRARRLNELDATWTETLGNQRLAANAIERLELAEDEAGAGYIMDTGEPEEES